MPWKTDYTTSDDRSLADVDVTWPNGQRCCATIVVDLSLAVSAEGVTERDLHTGRALFGLHEGLDAVTALLDALALKATFPVPGILAKLYGDKLNELEAAGHEIAAHGLFQEDVSKLSQAEEADRMAATTELITEVTGHSPAGWYSLPRQSDPFAVGTVSAHTIELLADSGYRYFGNGLADDIPYYWVAEFATRKNILTMPYYYHFDDQFFLMFPSRGTGLEHADALGANWNAELDAQLERGRFFTMVVHPHAIGWCNRFRVLEKFWRRIAGDVECDLRRVRRVLARTFPGPRRAHAQTERLERPSRKPELSGKGTTAEATRLVDLGRLGSSISDLLGSSISDVAAR